MSLAPQPLDTKARQTPPSPLSTSDRNDVVTGDDYDTISATNINLSQGELEDLREAFRLFDTSNTGTISVGYFRSVLMELVSECQVTKPALPVRRDCTTNTALEQHLARLTERLSCQANEECLDVDSFIRLLTSAKTSSSDREESTDELKDLFDLFDQGGKGYIDLADLRVAATEMGEIMEDDELQEMMSCASPSSRVSFAEFQDIMTKKIFSG